MDGRKSELSEEDACGMFTKALIPSLFSGAALDNS